MRSIGFLIFTFFFSSHVFPANSASLVVWDTPEGLSRIQNSQAKASFWKLLRYYDSQKSLTSCGVAAAVVVLNALSIEAPPSKILGKWRMFTLEEFFS